LNKKYDDDDKPQSYNICVRNILTFHTKNHYLKCQFNYTVQYYQKSTFRQSSGTVINWADIL